MIVWPVLGGSPYEAVAMETGNDRLLVSYHKYGPNSPQQLRDLADDARAKIEERRRQESPP